MTKGTSPFSRVLCSLMAEPPVTTQAQLAEITGKTRQTISQYVNGISEPGYDTLVKIADHFRISLDYLLGRSNVRTLDANIQLACEITGLNEQSIYLLQRFMTSDYEDYGDASKYAFDLINDFIDFAIDGYSEPYTLPLLTYLRFRHCNKLHRLEVSKWEKMSTTEKTTHSDRIKDIQSDSYESGIYPLSPDDAADYFRTSICDDFKIYLNNKYPSYHLKSTRGASNGND